MVEVRLELSRSQVLTFRRRVAGLHERRPSGRRSLRRAAWAGLQDSMPRAALLSLHARVEGTEPTTWEDPSLVQLWGPRFSVYVVAERDRAVFSFGRLPEDGEGRRRAEDLAARLHALLGGSVMTDRDAAQALGENPNRLRYAAPTGTILLRWDGARAPTIRTVPAPEDDPRSARRELARRYLHVFGPTTPGAFAQWAGLPRPQGEATFDALRRSLLPVRTPIGDSWILARDEPAFLADPEPDTPVRLLPSGDTYVLLQGADRELVVPVARHRSELWPSRVWPGALLLQGEVTGTWRRVRGTVTIRPWRTLTPGEREAVHAEVASLPLPGVEGQAGVRWEE